MTVLIYVDNMIIASNDNKEIVALKDFLCTKFRIIDLRQLQYFVRIEVARFAQEISISTCKLL